MNNYGIRVVLRLKCVRIWSEPVIGPNRLVLYHCDFSDDNGNKVSDVHYTCPDDRPLHIKEGDLCVIIFNSLRYSDLTFAGHPLDPEE